LKPFCVHVKIWIHSVFDLKPFCIHMKIWIHSVCIWKFETILYSCEKLKWFYVYEKIWKHFATFNSSTFFENSICHIKYMINLTDHFIWRQQTTFVINFFLDYNKTAIENMSYLPQLNQVRGIIRHPPLCANDRNWKPIRLKSAVIYAMLLVTSDRTWLEFRRAGLVVIVL
jgi:hypothetical protein